MKILPLFKYDRLCYLCHLRIGPRHIVRLQDREIFVCDNCFREGLLLKELWPYTREFVSVVR